MTYFTKLSPLSSEAQADAGHDRVLASAPHRIGKVTLAVRDVDKMAEFYRAAIGLQPMGPGLGGLQFGVGDAVLIELRHDPEARLATRQEAGLFHTAFLLPTRADLGAWLAFAIERGLPLQGASDHLVSEALYMSDPEGNGIEVYVDRPSNEWPRSDGMIKMASESLDLLDLANAAGDRTWGGFPAQGVIGHVHLQVGDNAAAEAFYGSVLGFDLTCRYPNANFYGSGGYHHQLATNVWNSRGAPMRSSGTTGLADVEILAGASMLDELRSKLPSSLLDVDTPEGVSLRDPWGTSISLRAG